MEDAGQPMILQGAAEGVSILQISAAIRREPAQLPNKTR
jgi:hypothetical protein